MHVIVRALAFGYKNVRSVEAETFGHFIFLASCINSLIRLLAER